MRLRTALLAPVLLLLAAASPSPAEQAAAASRIRADVAFLADDLLEGRETGTRGYDIAARYVAARFQAIGLQPAGDNGGWYAAVPFREASHGRPPPAASLILDGSRSPLRIGGDIAIAPSVTEKQRAVESELVFVGYGLSEPALGLDDYRGLDVRGKTVVAFAENPPDLPSDVAAHLSAAKAETAARHGAIGFIDISTEANSGSRSSMQSYAVKPVIDWVDAQGRAGTQPQGLRFMAAVSASFAERLFAGAPQGLSQLRARAGRGEPVRGFALRPRLAVSATSQWRDYTSPNIVGRIPGGDAALRDQHVVLMAHLDHLGIKRGAKPGEDAIYNGVLDNAAGIATLLESARTFITSGKPPRRSILFIANTGEETGLHGAGYFAEHPTVPIERIVGVIDYDMPLLTYAFNDVIAFGAEHSTIASIAADAARSMDVAISPDPMPHETLFVRSDHYRFVQQGVPAVFLMTGHGNGGKAAWAHYLARVYHQPNEDLTQPIDWLQGARFAELNYRIARAIADADRRPLWYEGDFFGERFAPGQPRAKR